MQELESDNELSLYAFGDGAVVRCATESNEKDEIIWRPDDAILYREDITAKKISTHVYNR